jgi:hypothetical protein
MDVEKQIDAYIAGQPAAKSADITALHQMILKLAPNARLWFLDGKNELGKTVSNPNIGYGFQTMGLAGGKTREFYQVGLSANTSGISVYIMGIADKDYLRREFADKIGKAEVTGYCIRFRTLKDIDAEVLMEAVRLGLGC